MLSNGVPEDKRGCSDKGVDLFSNNVLIISRLLKVDCDMGQTRWNANLPSEIQTKISLCYTFNLIKTVNTFRLFISLWSLWQKNLDTIFFYHKMPFSVLTHHSI